MTVVLAPAKLTTSLRIVGRRGDGYHLLEAEMVAVDLADRLELTEGEGLEVVGAGILKGSSLMKAVPKGPDNLVAKALSAVSKRARVNLEKHIPPGAGLGGGSSDAAAVLRWAGCMDTGLAVSLGADVPFCLHGGRAHVSGIGDVVADKGFIPEVFTLLILEFGVSTGEVYKAFDELGGPSRSPGGRYVSNDLEPAALAVEPRLAPWREWLARASGSRPVLAGSGSTWFVRGRLQARSRWFTTDPDASRIAKGATPGAGSASCGSIPPATAKSRTPGISRVSLQGEQGWLVEVSSVPSGW
ncbi:MAG: 4-(cytidine 5'-diphospho)-2-C-methyl-D-erythritol kinase [Actinobacteria bacterium]|nr:4-(cytidine 5'-diphospho)-2-C-methyl-D-erythritol kinase [Actinomycetota bacterium]